MTDQITAQNFHARFEAYHKSAVPGTWRMIRPDRYFDHPNHCYPDEDARHKGNDAMRDWFEYLAAKGFITIFNSWRGILKSGQSIMVVCADPLAFDREFVPPIKNVLSSDFWDEWSQSRIPIDRRYDSVEQRMRIVKIARDCASELRMFGAKRPPSNPVRPLREWKSIPLEEIDVNKPLPKLSDDIRKQLGCMIPEMSKDAAE
jgi:hypothetical protein